tara:strand:+ start:6152 stop:6838 length:687 start_codon:yes stop_codon:yes gene_type:complete
MNDINEKLSALYDGELNMDEIDDLLDIISKDQSLQKKLSMYGLITQASIDDFNNVVPLKSKMARSNKFSSNVWLSNSITAAASIALTLIFVNNVDLSRMGISSSYTDQISSAINSKEAKVVAFKSEENLADYVMKVINDPNFMNSNQSLDLKNVGFSKNSPKSYVYSKGNQNFKLRIEKNNFGLTQIKYWKHGNKMIYLIPLPDGNALTLYGNINLPTAISISQSINS